MKSIQKIFRLQLLLLCQIFTALCLCSCANEYQPYEILHLPKYQPTYTCYTLWYTDPMNMTSENIQQGTIIPFGTEVMLFKMTDSEIRFYLNEKEFCIKLADSALESIQSFVKRTFSDKTADQLLQNSSAAEFEKIRRGVVSEGMTESQVLVALGKPSLSRSPNLKDNTWIYQAGPVKSKRIIFQNNGKGKERTVQRIFEL